MTTAGIASAFAAEHGAGPAYSALYLDSRDACNTWDAGYFLCLSQMKTSGKVSQV